MPHRSPGKAPSRRTQMADIARMAGVSTSTVSRALSGSELIPQATRERIVELARSLNYQVNVSAANLRKREVQTVGVVVLGENLQSISDPFMLQLVGGVADALDRRDLGALLTRHHANTPDRLEALYRSGQVCGLVLLGQYTLHEELNRLAMHGVPVVAWGAVLPTAQYPIVGSDNEMGGYLATQHLLAQGCRRVAFFGDVSHPEMGLRYQGYTRAHRDVGLEVDPALQHPVLFGEPDLQRVIQRWLDKDEDFDGVFTSSDVTAMALMGLMKARGISVPGDVKVVGFDDIPMADHYHPRLTSVNQGVHLAGEALVARLTARLAGQVTDHLMLPTSLQVRDSST